MLHLKCKGQEMKVDVDERIADKYINANKVHFEFCERWAGMIITAQFTQKQDGVDKTYDVVVDELTNMVTMPNEIVAGEVHISAFGVDPVTGVRITSIPVKKTIDKSGFVGDGETPVPPTPDLYAQLLEQFGNGVPPSTGAYKQLVTDKSGAIVWDNLRVMAGTNHGSVRTSAAAAEQTLGYKLGNAAFAANMETEASGQAAFAAGFGTEAIGKNSFAEGQHTIANGENQHVQGKFNVKDTANKYAHIVGNGMTSAKRANAHTLDWDGNAWFKGDVYVGGDDQSKGEKLVTKSELDAAVAAGGGGSGEGGGGGLPTGGEPNMMLVTDSEGNAKWDERTHWKEEGLLDVLPETTINVADFGEDASELPIMQAFSSPIVVGEEYVATYNGTEYTTTAFELQLTAEAPLLPALGNRGAIGGEDTGEPFIIIYFPDEFKEMAGGVSGFLMPMDGAAIITLRIQRDGVVYHKLDPGYLPIPITGGMIDILPETNASVSEEMGGAIFTNPLHGEIVIGNKYTVTYNGTEYVCTAWAAPSESGSDAPALGNKAMIGEDDTGEPFVFLYIPPEMLETTGGIYAMLMPRDGATEVTVSIQSEADLKIDNSALALDWIPKKESVGATILPTVSFVVSTNVPVSVYDKINLGSTYVVLFDGVRYECVAQEYMGIAKLLGNPSVMGITNIPGQGEPFCVAAFTEGGTGARVAENDTAFHEVAVYEKGNAQKVANVLPNEFMPSGVMRSLCIMSSNYTAYLNGDDISENPTYTANMGASGVVEALEAGELSNVCLYEYNGYKPCVFHSVGIYIASDVVHILMSYRDPYDTNKEQLRSVEIAYGDIKVTEVT